MPQANVERAEVAAAAAGAVFADVAEAGIERQSRCGSP